MSEEKFLYISKVETSTWPQLADNAWHLNLKWSITFRPSPGIEPVYIVITSVRTRSQRILIYTEWQNCSLTMYTSILTGVSHRMYYRKNGNTDKWTLRITIIILCYLPTSNLCRYILTQRMMVHLRVIDCKSQIQTGAILCVYYSITCSQNCEDLWVIDMF